MPSLPTDAANDNHNVREAALSSAVADLRRALGATLRAEATFAEHDAETLRVANGLLRRSLTLELEGIVACFGDGELRVDGRRYRRHQREKFGEYQLSSRGVWDLLSDAGREGAVGAGSPRWAPRCMLAP